MIIMNNYHQLPVSPWCQAYSKVGRLFPVRLSIRLFAGFYRYYAPRINKDPATLLAGI